MSIITRGLKGNLITGGFRSLLALAQKLAKGILSFYNKIETIIKRTIFKVDVEEAQSKIFITKLFINAENIDIDKKHAKIDMITKIYSNISEDNNEHL